MTGRKRRYCTAECGKRARALAARTGEKPGPKRKGATSVCALNGCEEVVYRRPSDLERYGTVYCCRAHADKARREAMTPCKCGCGEIPTAGRWYVEGHAPVRPELTEEERAERAAAKRAYIQTRRFNITVIQYDDLLESQGGGCAICGKTPEEEGKRLSLDHDHGCCPQEAGSCGLCIRGILCDSCNQRVMVHERADRQTEYPDAALYLARYARDGSPILAAVNAMLDDVLAASA